MGKKVLIEYKGELLSLRQIADLTGTKYTTIKQRHYQGMDLFAPIRQKFVPEILSDMQKCAGNCGGFYPISSYRHRAIQCNKCSDRRTYQTRLRRLKNEGHDGIGICHSDGCNQLKTQVNSHCVECKNEEES